MSLIRKQIKTRIQDQQIFKGAQDLGFSALQARIIAGRANGKGGYNLENVLFPALKNLHHPELLQDSGRAADYIVEAIREGKRIGILTDYDVDGICSHVVVYESLKHFAVSEDSLISLIGHRMNDGYGISASLVDKILALDKLPELIITADCGSSDELQISRLKESGIAVIVTDHHTIPVEGVPVSALSTINPSRNDCLYPDKFISGCMVSWLLMCLVRSRLIGHGILAEDTAKLGGLLDFVGLSTVADAVTFTSPTNRAVANGGLQVINQLAKPPWFVLAKQLGKNERNPFTVEDLAFQIAPRINARSRMADPYAALNFFMASDAHQAGEHLQRLEKNNEERKITERNMVKIARQKAKKLHESQHSSLVISDSNFHAGVQGIVASRLVDSFGKPTVVLSPMLEGDILSGSARTIQAVHLLKVLQKINERYPDLFLSFGGHSGAAGLKIKKEDFAVFCTAFEKAVQEEIQNRKLEPIVLTDGDLEVELLNLETLSELQKLEPYGREFEEPAFAGVFTVTKTRIVGAVPVHLALKLEKEGRKFQGIWFNAMENPGDSQAINEGTTVRCVYKLKLNTFRGQRNLQLLVEYAEPE
ncbi:MAG: single-stranded-DNA-specific exonuclease RecJ [Proteobacteria bacterium]|nr:single-stranded-DNA-specific exonuclease RecJ [Pseudomonadota bacterium]MBU4298279.1 single-stranded-DNA-specific exonuclease RecJ [Pseudomonadota bacterium]MCG2747546.1 single-stranded-DNA-specific exonuclease RecJ [Desulfobulbaceae bacterium]